MGSEDLERVGPGSIGTGIELPGQCLSAHETYLAEDGPFRPGSVMDSPDAPGDSGIAVGVPPVDLVFVVEVDSNPLGLFR